MGNDAMCEYTVIPTVGKSCVVLGLHTIISENDEL